MRRTVWKRGGGGEVSSVRERATAVSGKEAAGAIATKDAASAAPALGAGSAAVTTATGVFSESGRQQPGARMVSGAPGVRGRQHACAARAVFRAQAEKQALPAGNAGASASPARTASAA